MGFVQKESAGFSDLDFAYGLKSLRWHIPLEPRERLFLSVSVRIIAIMKMWFLCCGNKFGVIRFVILSVHTLYMSLRYIQKFALLVRPKWYRICHVPSRYHVYR